jgi:hypothetical protein
MYLNAFLKPRVDLHRVDVCMIGVIVTGSLLVFTSWQSASGQEATTDLSFQRLTVEDDLSHPRVNCIHQDRTG